VSRNLRFALLAVALGTGAAALGFAVHYWLRATSVTVPAGASEFVLIDLAGKTHRLGDYRGKLVLLNFWATWCPPCRREIPGFIRLQTRYGARGLQVVGISIDNPEAVARYWQEMKINYPLLLADDTIFGLMGAYGNASGGLPYSVLIRPDGGIAATKLGAYEETELERLIQPLLPQK
jgi:peroxiredoxin